MSRKPLLSAEQKPSRKLTVKIDDLLILNPLTENQKKFFNTYKNSVITLLNGAPGTGKSMIAIYKALEEVLDKGNRFQKLYIIRSAVPSRDIGHLPGDIDEKTEVYVRPYIDICSFLFERTDAFARLREQGVIEFMTTSHVRGINLSNCVIITDEIQNLNEHEINSVVTRLGNNSKLILCGDIKQTDLHKKYDTSGFNLLVNIGKLMPKNIFNHIEFGVEDIVRSSTVKEWIIAKIKYDESSNKSINKE